MPQPLITESDITSCVDNQTVNYFGRFHNFPPVVLSRLHLQARTMRERRNSMTPETLAAPELEEAVEESKDAEHLLPNNGNGGPQRRLPACPDAEIQKLDEDQLKSAILFAWKKHEELAKAELAPLLYWLRE